MSRKTTLVLLFIAFAVLLTATPARAETPPNDEVTDTHVTFNGTKWLFFSKDPDAKAGDTWEIGKSAPFCVFQPEGRIDRLYSLILQCKGTPLGYIRTEKKYKDFHLTLKFNRPTDTRPDGTKSLGKGGILIRTTGKDKIWPKSLEAQINHGGEGDFWGLNGYKFTGPEDRMKKLEDTPFGDLTNLTPEKRPELDLKTEWHSYEVIAKGPTVTIKIDGKVVNQAENCEDVPGYICITSEGDPIEFQAITISELDESGNPTTEAE